MMREVFSPESAPVEAKKIKTIHATSGPYNHTRPQTRPPPKTSTFSPATIISSLHETARL
jgi:hypothetical protein